MTRAFGYRKKSRREGPNVDTVNRHQPMTTLSNRSDNTLPKLGRTVQNCTLLLLKGIAVRDWHGS